MTRVAETLSEAVTAIRSAERILKDTSVGIKPTVLMNKEIDHDQFTSYCHYRFDNTFAATLKDMIEDGWIVYCVRIEVYGSDHSIMIYLAKMRAN